MRKAMEEYVVQYENTLKTIAKNKLGDENRWYEIAQLNNIQSPYQLFIGETIKLPNRISMFKPQPPANVELPPALMSYARGFLFVVFEQLPTIGSNKIVRKIAVLPTDFSKHPNLSPKNSFSSISEARHALGENDSRFLSGSNRTLGSPTNVSELIADRYGNKIPPNANPADFINQNRPVIIDLDKLPPGTRIVSEADLIGFLKQEIKLRPEQEARILTTMERIKNIEGEMLIEGSAPKNSVKKVSNLHSAYVSTAEELTAKYRLGKITEAEFNEKYKALGKSYERMKIVGHAGRVITVVGMAFTAVEMAQAAQKSYVQNSFKPIAAESIRQVGGWGGAIAGAKIGFGVGAWLGAPTGPWLVVSGIIGAIIFGGLGYAGADWLADWIDDNSIQELRKDVNFAEGLKNRDIVLIIGANENQYDFRRRALIEAAMQVQRESFRMVDSGLPARFADKLVPLRTSNITDDYKLNWIKTPTAQIPNSIQTRTET